MTNIVDNDKPLYIPSSKRLAGLVVYCRRCKTNMLDVCKLTGKSLKHCPNGNQHVFKIYVHVPDSKNERRTKNLKTRNLDEAIQQAIEFRNEIKRGNNKKDIDEKPKVNVNNDICRENSNQQIKLIQAMARYIGWLNNEGVPAHMVKIRSNEHIKDVERAFKVLAESLKCSGQRISELTVDDINNNVVGQIYSYLEGKNFANRTFNKYFSYYTSFIKWYSLEYDVSIKNCFELVRRKKLNPQPEAITKSEYEALLNLIKPEKGIREYERGVKPERNVYRPWLAHGIRLALETGRRREEVINLKWCNIEESDGIQFIKVEDYKVNRIQNRNTEEEKKFIYVPITKSLKELLNELGYNDYANTDNFILAPEIDISRGRIMSDVLSRGFSHYYNQLNTGRKLTFKSLRKAYITNLQIFFSGNGDTKAITGHSDDQVIERNYIDKKEIAKASRYFSVFSKEIKRNNDLKKIRKEEKKRLQKIELEL
jgi:integrase